MTLRTRIFGGYVLLLIGWLVAWVYLTQHLETVHSLLNSISPLELARGQLVREIHSRLTAQEGSVTIASSALTRGSPEAHRHSLAQDREAAMRAIDSLRNIEITMFELFDHSYRHVLTRWLYRLHENREDFEAQNRRVHDIEDRLILTMSDDLRALGALTDQYLDELTSRRAHLKTGTIIANLDEIRNRLRFYESLTAEHTLNRVAMVGKMSQALTLLNYLILGIMAVFVSILTYDAYRVWVGFQTLHRGTLAVAKGEFQTQLHLKNFKEIEDLADSFNDMANQLHELQKLRADFFNKLVHDFKSPLDNIKQSADLLMDSAGAFDEQHLRFLEIIKRSSMHLRQMVQEQLDESRLIAGQSNLQYEWASLLQLVRERVELQRPSATGKGVEFELRFTNSPYELYMDRHKIMRVVDNLTSNAIKFSPAHGIVSIEIEDFHDVMQMRVKDNGPGIPSGHRDKVFRKYGRLATADNPGGTGLGLYTCKYIVELHGGKIWFHTKEGKGTTFYFTLPKKGRSASAGGSSPKA